MRRIATMTTALVLMVALGVQAADWPNFLGPNRDGISTETGINKDWGAKRPKQVWKVAMSDGGYAGPAVAGGVVYIVDHRGSDDVVRALSLKNGTKIWEFSYADARRNNYGFARATPTVDGEHVYTIGRLGQLYCLRTKDGSKVWDVNIVKKFRAKPPKWQFSGSLLIDGDNVIVGAGGKGASVVALNKKTGATVWKGGGSDIAGYATPVVAELDKKKQYVIFTAKRLIGVSAADGKTIWSYPWRTGYDVNAATPIVSSDTVFITSNYRRGCAVVKVSGANATKVWENKAMQSHWSTPIYHEGHIYGASDPNKFVCLDYKTGAVKWAQKGFGKGGQVAVDGCIIALNGKRGSAHLIEMTPEGYKELGKFTPLGGKSWTAPIVADGKLIVRNEKALACFDLK
jgi:outer membrane protein assembly factor BamB